MRKLITFIMAALINCQLLYAQEDRVIRQVHKEVFPWDSYCMDDFHSKYSQMAYSILRSEGYIADCIDYCINAIVDGDPDGLLILKWVKKVRRRSLKKTINSMDYITWRTTKKRIRNYDKFLY